MLALKLLRVPHRHLSRVPCRHLFNLSDINEQARQSANAAKKYAEESATGLTDASIDAALEQSKKMMKLSEEKFRNEGVDITVTFSLGPISVTLTQRSSELSVATPEE